MIKKPLLEESFYNNNNNNNTTSSTFSHSSHTAMASLHRLTLSPTVYPSSTITSSTFTMNYMFMTPRGKTCILSIPSTASYDAFLRALLEKAAVMDQPELALAHSSKDEIGLCQVEMTSKPVSKGLGVVRKWHAPYERCVRRRIIDPTRIPIMMSFSQDDGNEEHDEESSISSSSFSSSSSSSSAAALSSSCSSSPYDIEMREFEPFEGKRDSLKKINSTNTTSSYHQLSNIHFSKLAYVVFNGKILDREAYYTLTSNASALNDTYLHHISLRLRVCGGIDRQNRVGSKFGGGGVSSAQQSERERKDRLRQLALETVDLAKDPYLMRNHLGSYECKLCLTLHTNEGNYLAHTQGKKHTTNLAKRAAMEQKLKGKQEEGPVVSTKAASSATSAIRRVKIGRPAYDIFKSRHYETQQRCLSFQLHFPEINDNIQPRHRFMSAFEQKVETPDRKYQYLLIAADPYETVAFKIPNEPIDKREGKFVTNWDAAEKKFTLSLHFADPDKS